MIEAGKTYPLRGGLTARIIVTDIKGGRRPIGGYVNHGDREVYQAWHLNGRAWDHATSDYDIVMPEPERKSRWINWYGTSGGRTEYKTRGLADKSAADNRTHVLEIITENGEPVEVKIHKVTK